LLQLGTEAQLESVKVDVPTQAGEGPFMEMPLCIMTSVALPTRPTHILILALLLMHVIPAKLLR
jgi:hypothetical protein